MNRYLMILGVALAAAVTASIALSGSPAKAVEEETFPLWFTAAVGSEEVAKIDGEQIGTNTMAIEGLPPVSCSSIKYNGEATTAGPVPKRVRIAPQYESCHVTTILGPRTTTVIPNGCTFEIEPEGKFTESGEEDYVGVTDLACPSGKAITVEVFNTSSENHSGASLLCKFDIEPQTNLTGTTLIDKETDVVSSFNMTSVKVLATGGSLCGEGSKTGSYKGEATLRTTNAAGQFVSGLVENKKRFVFEDPKPTAKGEKGGAELTTEKVTVKCTEVEYVAEPGKLEPNELSFKPTYKGCTALEGETDVEFQGCVYTMKFNEPVDFVGGKSQTPTSFQVVCGTGKEIKITVTKKGEKGKVECSLVIPGQAALKTVTFKNLRGKKGTEDSLTLIHNVQSLNYEVKNNAAVCGKNELHKDGKLTGEINVKAFKPGGEQMGVIMKGTEP
jgi:hypothetical protein